MATNNVLNAARIALARSVPIEHVADERSIRLRGRVERAGPCPVCGGTDRFAINIKKQVWNCRGCQKGGDVIALVRHLDGVDFRTAVQTLLGEAPTTACVRPNPIPDARKLETEEYERRQHRKARWLWQNRRVISDTPAETYLRQARGYIGAIPPTLAYLPPARPEHYPALIAAFALVDEIEPGVLASPCNVDAVHLTLLQANGADKAPVEKPKLIIGRPLGRPIVLAPANDLLGLAITEGIEDGLSIYQATKLGVWVAGSAVQMPTLADAVPHYLDCVTIVADPDEAGQRNSAELARRLNLRGIHAEISSWREPRHDRRDANDSCARMVPTHCERLRHSAAPKAEKKWQSNRRRSA